MHVAGCPQNSQEGIRSPLKELQMIVSDLMSVLGTQLPYPFRTQAPVGGVLTTDSTSGEKQEAAAPSLPWLWPRTRVDGQGSDLNYCSILPSAD